MKSQTHPEDRAILSFIHAAKCMLNHFSIGDSSHQWGIFLASIHPSSTPEGLIAQAEDVFNLTFTPVDLNMLLPDNYHYLLHDGNEWFFTKDVNSYSSDAATAYIVRERQTVDKSFSIMRLIRNKSILAIFVVSFLVNIFALTTPLYFNAIYGRIIPAGAESSLWTLSFIAFLCFLCEFLLKQSKKKYTFKLLSQYKDTLQSDIFSMITRVNSSKENHWGRERGYAIRLLKELNMLFWGLLSTNFLDIFFVFLFLSVIYIMSGSLVLVPIIFLIVELGLGLYFTYFFEEKKQPMMKDIDDTAVENHRINGVEENLNSVNFYQESTFYHISQYNQQQRQTLSSLLAFVSSCQSIFITVMAFFLIQQHTLSVASLFAVIILSSRISQSAMSFVQVIPTIKTITHKVNELKAFLKKNEIQPVETLSDLPAHFKWSLQEVTFGYEKTMPLFDRLNLTINSGEKIAFIGHAGSGKTVLAKLLTGVLSPEQGKLCVIDQHGQRVAPQALNREMHYMPQQPFFFGDSLMTHLCSEKPFTEEQCKKVLTQDFLSWLPPLLNNGLYTWFQHLPYPLSAAQKSLLMLPRFQLTERQIWVWDEPLLLAENKVKQKFITAARNKMTQETTLLLFTDNVDYLELVDRVVAFNNGKIIFDGPRSEFIQQYAN
ncbi:MAG: Protein glycosylation K [Candidatus Erwinia impunctatus]|nr:Protein glycosylation K [Culicoides impunctatus]